MHVVVVPSIAVGREEFAKQPGLLQPTGELVQGGPRVARAVEAPREILLDPKRLVALEHFVDINGQPMGVQAEPAPTGGTVRIRAGKANARDAESPEFRPDLMQGNCHPTVQNQRNASMGGVTYAAELARYLDCSLDAGFC